MKNKVLYLIFCAIVLSGCDKDPVDDLDGVHDIVINFTFDSLPLSLSKATFPEEKVINKIILLGVDDNGAFHQDFIITESILLAPEGITLESVYRRVKKFYAIANPTPVMESDIATAKTTPTTFVTFLQGMTCNFATHPQSPFVMSGIGDVNGYQATIDLERTVARVEITMPTGFTVQSVSVENTPNRGYVFKRAAPITLPTGNTMVKYEIVTQASTITAFLYVAENNTTSPTEFVVKGLFENLPTDATFRITTPPGNQVVNIERNKNYKVTLTMSP